MRVIIAYENYILHLEGHAVNDNFLSTGSTVVYIIELWRECMPEPVDVERLGQRLRRVRDKRGLTLEQLSKETGVSVATISRVERGGSKEIDAGTLVQICQWMGVRPEEFRPGAEPPKVPGRRAPASTPEAVELYLRADKSLEPKTAALLSDMFKAAYERLAKG